jgi:hypothetical protein
MRADSGPGAGRHARLALCLVPYGTVAAGLYLAHSAWIALLSYHLGMAGALLWARGRWRGLTRPGQGDRTATGLTAIGSGWSSGTGAALALLCAGNGAAFVLLWPVVVRPGIRLPAVLEGVGLSPGAGLALFALWYVTVHPVLEEWFWRGLLYDPSPRPALSDAAFAGYHALVLAIFLRPEWTALSVACLLGAGWIFRRIAARHGGLAVPVAAHAVAGASTMAAVWWLARPCP